MEGSYKQTIAFLGATGGTGLACLAAALKEGHYCTALVRTPTKLTTLLVETHSLDQTILSTYLTLHTGNAKSPLDVAKALVNPTDPTLLVDVIWSSIGTYPVWQWSITTPLVLPDPTICEDGMAALFAGIDHLASQSITVSQSGKKPLLIVVSATTGENKWTSLPWVYIPLYAWLLKSPEADKFRMEKLIKADRGEHVRDFLVVRPAILTDGATRGGDKVRVGWVWADERKKKIEGAEREKGYAVGYSVGKKDVGNWVYRNIVVDGGWEGREVSLCY